jgi:hypothetical protein
MNFGTRSIPTFRPHDGLVAASGIIIAIIIGITG